jgi:hypothetical protein
VKDEANGSDRKRPPLPAFRRRLFFPKLSLRKLTLRVGREAAVAHLLAHDFSAKLFKLRAHLASSLLLAPGHALP